MTGFPAGCTTEPSCAATVIRRAGKMAQSEAFKMFLAGSPPKNLRLAAARGMAPLPRNELLAVMVRLCGDADSDVAAAADNTLREWPEPEIIEEISSTSCAPEVLAHFAATSGSDVVR